MDLLLRAAYGDIEPVFAALLIEPAEFAHYLSIGISGITHGEYDYVSLVALNGLYVLDEKAYVLAVPPAHQLCADFRRKIGVFYALLVDQVVYEVSLGYVECNYSYCLIVLPLVEERL